MSADDLVECLDYRRGAFCKAWQKGIGWLIDEPKGRFVERYLGGDMAIVLLRREPTGSRETIQDGLVLHLPIDEFERSARDLKVKADNLRSCGKKPYVLAPDIELMEGVKKRVSAFVRHGRFDKGLFALGKPRFAFNTLGAEEIVQGTENWKVRFVARFYAVPCSESGGEHVETGSDRVDDRASFGIDHPVNWSLWIGGQELVGRVDIRLYHEHIRAVPLPGCEALLERWDLGYGPIDGSLSV